MKKYYLMAIEKGNTNAMNNLGNHYKKFGDYDNMKKYYLMAIKKGNNYTQNQLNEYYKEIKNRGQNKENPNQQEQTKILKEDQNRIEQNNRIEEELEEQNRLLREIKHTQEMNEQNRIWEEYRRDKELNGYKNESWYQLGYKSERDYTYSIFGRR
jgi:hypothetical protein